MGYLMEVSDRTFEQDVIQQSYETPVLVDFYATWCGPCQMLKPMLAKVAEEYDCVVAKLDIDRSPEMANAYRVEGVPDVKVFRQGQVIDGFVGVLPTPQLQEFLARCGIRSGVEEGLEKVQGLVASGQFAEAEHGFLALQKTYPKDARVAIAAAKFWINRDRPELAEELLSAIGEDNREFYPQAQAVKALAQFKQECQQPSGNSESDRLFAQACCAAVQENYEEALQLFIELVGKDRKYKNDGARKAAIAIFDLLGSTHPLTMDYRKQLTMALY